MSVPTKQNFVSETFQVRNLSILLVEILNSDTEGGGRGNYHDKTIIYINSRFTLDLKLIRRVNRSEAYAWEHNTWAELLVRPLNVPKNILISYCNRYTCICQLIAVEWFAKYLLHPSKLTQWRRERKRVLAVSSCAVTRVRIYVCYYA